jgi:hypothetical protein
VGFCSPAIHGCARQIVPALMRRGPGLAPLAAAGLTTENVALAVLFGRCSIEVAATNPFVCVVAVAIMAAFVVYGRYAILSAP